MAQTFEDKIDVHLRVTEFPRGVVFRRYRLPNSETVPFMVENMGSRIVVEVVDRPELTKADVDQAARKGRALPSDSTMICVPAKARVGKDVEEYAEGAKVAIKRLEL